MAVNPKSTPKSSSKSAPKSAPKNPSEGIRLNKYLSECGIASRRKADELISEGAVIINGKKVYELGTRVNPNDDRITVNGKPVKPTTHKVYILFHKPKNVVTTMEDPAGRPTIADFFERLPVRVFPVGRLDWDTEGMILLTNDGEFAQKVNHPSEEILKTYLVKVDGHPSEESLERLRRGVSVIGGRVTAKGIERIRRGDSEKYDWIKVMISEGKNRQVRRMFEKIGFDVIKLQRVAIGRLRMPGSLKRGEYVFLTEAGLKKIFEGERKEAVPVPRQRSAKTDARATASRKPRAAGAGGRSAHPRTR
jgi:23S rRNA pseudouridine2605 synthase